MQYKRTAYSVLLRKALGNVASNTKHRSQAFRNFQICYLMGGKKHEKVICRPKIRSVFSVTANALQD